jgi:N-acetylneuraminic acid mutarotase
MGMKFSNDRIYLIFIPLLVSFLFQKSTFCKSRKIDFKAKVKWIKKSPMPGPLYAFDAASIGHKIFAVGGRGGKDKYERYNYVFDPQTNLWEVGKELIYDRSNHAVVALEGKIYVFGGNENPDKTEVYDPTTDVWKELAAIPTPRQHINYSAAAAHGKIYLIGGIEKRGEKEFIITDKNEVYDPTTNTWAEKSPIPSKRQIPAVISYREKIYVISGTDSNWDDQSTVYVYDPETDRWETKASMPEARYISGVALIHQKIVVITGIRSTYKKSKIYIYDPENDTWDYVVELPQYFMLAGVASVGGKLYILGGSNLEFILFSCLEGDISF